MGLGYEIDEGKSLWGGEFWVFGFYFGRGGGMRDEVNDRGGE